LINVELEHIGKKFKTEWIFRNLNAILSPDEPMAIIGPNGSGKSTLMQAIAGIIPINEGEVKYLYQKQPLSEENWHKHLVFTSPYMELIEEFTLKEAVKFHIQFKPLSDGLSIDSFLEKLELTAHAHKPIKNFSSGMRQKVKLGFAFFSESSLIFLDEPSANLDQKAFDWYMENVKKMIGKKMILLSSNEPKEYSFCGQHLNILDFKA
jgi:ABC-type multidrug transport system ATPase subunit